MKRKLLILICLFLFNLAFANENTFENKFFVFQTDLTLTLTTDNSKALSPITYGVGMNFQIPLVRFNTYFKTGFFFLPQITAFYNYYKVDYFGNVVRSELENRMATVPAVMLNLPFSYNMIAANNTFHAVIGIAFLGRMGFKSTKATQDFELNRINDTFYKDLCWLYPNASVSFDTKVGNSTVGFSTAFFIPMNNLLNTKDLNEAKFTVAFRLGL